jgi:glycine/D-amino acid oxidase-like deaminating enzyme/nitrite reductase/ring-hydroxylating ferredoxin subunit
MSHKTLWYEKQEMPHYEALTRSVSCDVAVIGAGIAGLSVAYNALKKGLSVIVLEDGEIGRGETGRTSAHLSNALDDRYFTLEKYHGEKGARLAAESHSAAIDWIEELCRREKIDCDFERVEGYLFVPHGEDLSILEKEYDAAKRAGLPVTWAAKAPWPSYDSGKCLVFPRQAQFHPLRYLAGLARAVVDAGGQIFTHTHATSVVGGDEAVVETKGGHRVRARHIVVATHTPINEWLAIHTKQAAYRSYVVTAAVPKGAVPHGLYWDTADPYHYVRVAPMPSSSTDELLIIGGEDHKTGQPDPTKAPFAELASWARVRFPQLGEVVHEWSGQIIEPVDGLAFIGHSPLDKPNVYLCTGDSGNGLTHGTIAGVLITDLILGRANAWAEIYDPNRVTISSASEFIKENLNVAAQYLDWVTPGEAKEIKEIPRGSGAIIRSGLKKYAVYRNGQGGLSAMSAVCPHLGALVTWNTKENTWDCPAHGSRFSPTGQVLNGPANSRLEPLGKTEKAKL